MATFKIFDSGPSKGALGGAPEASGRPRDTWEDAGRPVVGCRAPYATPKQLILFWLFNRDAREGCGGNTDGPRPSAGALNFVPGC